MNTGKTDLLLIMKSEIARNGHLVSPSRYRVPIDMAQCNFGQVRINHIRHFCLLQTATEEIPVTL